MLRRLQPNHPPVSPYVRVVINTSFVLEVRNARDVQILFRLPEPEPVPCTGRVRKEHAYDNFNFERGVKRVKP